MLNPIFRKIKFFGQEINQQNKNRCHINKRVKWLATAAIMLAGSVTLAGVTLDRIDGILSSYSAGLEFANSEESQRAMVHFTRAAELYPYAPTAFVAKAKLMERLGRSHEAETELARAKEVQAHFGSGANIAFDTGTQMGEADQAVVHTLSQNVPLEKSSSTSSTTALSYHDTTRLIELYYQGLQSIFDGECRSQDLILQTL